MTWVKANGPLVCVGWCFAFRIFLAAGTDIYPDEAYYWAWSQHPQLSYFDHPALIAWSIALLGIRPGALLWGFVALWGVHQLARAFGATTERAWWATALFASTPAANVLGAFSTPDAPLLAFWVWTLVALVRKQPLISGLLWGLAMLSKYNGILLGVPLLVVFFPRPLHLFLASFTALAVTSPTLIWNATNNWEGFRFQIEHGLGGGGGIKTFLEFLAGQLGMAGPLLALMTLWWLARVPGKWFLKVATLIPLIFFGYASFKARGEANWASAAWLSASIGIALSDFEKWKRAALALNVVVLSIGVPLLVFPPRPLWTSQAIQKLHGWSWLAQAQRQHVPVFTGRYQLSALVSLYAQLPASTWGGRRSQYDLWPKPDIPAGSDALWIDENQGPPEALLALFETSTQLDYALDERQGALHPFCVFKLGNAKP